MYWAVVLRVGPATASSAGNLLEVQTLRPQPSQRLREVEPRSLFSQALWEMVMCAAGRDPPPEGSGDHPSSVKEPLVSSCALSFWSNAALLADGVPLADKHKKRRQIDIFGICHMYFPIKGSEKSCTKEI